MENKKPTIPATRMPKQMDSWKTTPRRPRKCAGEASETNLYNAKLERTGPLNDYKLVHRANDANEADAEPKDDTKNHEEP